MGEDGGIIGAEEACEGAQVLEPAEGFGQQGQGVVDGADVDGEDGLVAQGAEEGPWAAGHAGGGGGVVGQEHGLGRVALDEGFGAPDGDEEAVGVGEAFVDPGRVVAAVAGAVDRASGVGVGSAGEDQGHAGVVYRAGRLRARGGPHAGAGAEMLIFAKCC